MQSLRPIRARFALAGFALAAFLISGCGQAPGSTPSPSASTAQPPVTFSPPATPSSGTCLQADALTEEGYPQRAVAYVDQLNANVRSGEPMKCDDERARAIARMVAAERLGQAAASAQPAPRAATPTLGSVATTACALAGEPWSSDRDGLLVSALACDRENATTLALNERTPGPSPAESLKKSWDTFVTAIAPLQDVGLAFLLWLAVAIVLLQFMPIFMGNHLAGWCGERRRRGGVALGFGFVLLGSLVGTVGAALASTLSPSLSFAVFALGLTVAAVGLFVWDWRRREARKLLVTVEGKDTERAVDDLRGIVADLGASAPRGVEIPVGTDVTFLKDVDFAGLGGGAWTKAVQSLVQAIKPYTPWRLGVSVVSDDRLAVTLRRNNRFVESTIIDRQTFKLDEGTLKKLAAGGEDPEAPPLWSFPASLALCEMARKHGIKEGLSGATNWRALALQYLATTHFKGQDAISKALLGRAVDLDPGNKAAALAYAHATYRYSADKSELGEFAELLRECASPPMDQGASAATLDPGLRLRASFNLVVTRVNLAYLVDPEGRTKAITAAKNAQRDLRALFEELESSPAGKSELAGLLGTMKPRMIALAWSVHALDPTQEEPETHTSSGSGGPAAHYDQACQLMTLDGVAVDEVDLAIRLLTLADTNPELAAWRTQDPQLKTLRDTEKYKSAFGAPVPTDLLTIQPFASFEKLLRPVGLTTPSAIVAAGGDLERTLGPAAPVAKRMRQIAQLCLALERRRLGAWQVPLAELLEAKNVLILRPRPRLLKEAMECVDGFKDRPTEVELRNVFKEPRSRGTASE